VDTPEGAPKQDPRLQPTPDYGTLGPGADISAKTIDPKQRVGRLRAIAIVCGVVGALVFQFVGSEKGRAAWEQFQELISLHGKPEPASPAVLSGHELEKLENAPAQRQAELLLERAVNHYEGANDEIAARVDGWRGKIKLTNRLNSLAIAAINSNDLRVRAAALEVDLAAYGLEKTPASVDQLQQQAASGNQATRIWALWALGLMANRGVETAHVTQFLIGHLNDSDIETRHWAVEGLAIVGTDETIQPLLKTMHDDPSQMVRERAACSLAQSGMLKQEQRMSAVPQLLEFADDTSLDTATRAFTFHALRDITGKNLPDNAAAWHDWYNSR
jgi:HEAT repeat protein